MVAIDYATLSWQMSAFHLQLPAAMHEQLVTLNVQFIRCIVLANECYKFGVICSNMLANCCFQFAVY